MQLRTVRECIGASLVLLVTFGECNVLPEDCPLSGLPASTSPKTPAHLPSTSLSPTQTPHASGCTAAFHRPPARPTPVHPSSAARRTFLPHPGSCRTRRCSRALR